MNSRGDQAMRERGREERWGPRAEPESRMDEWWRIRSWRKGSPAPGLETFRAGGRVRSAGTSHGYWVGWELACTLVSPLSLQRPEEGIRSPGAGVTVAVSCCVSAGKQTQALSKSSKPTVFTALKPTEFSLQLPTNVCYILFTFTRNTTTAPWVCNKLSGLCG